MGRATEFIEFINSEIIPNDEEMEFRYSYLTKTKKLKKARKKYRKNIKEKSNG